MALRGQGTTPRDLAGTGLTAALAEISCGVAYEDLPTDVVEIARHALLDWLGVTLAGSREELTEILTRTVLRDERAGAATLVGRAERAAPLPAALINGTASHALDFDDVNAGFMGHVSVAMLGAALALGEEIDASAGDLIAAYAAGYEVACRIAAAIGPEPYRRGFHQTGTVGTFAAAGACARLLGLDRPATATALGLAASQAAGCKCNFGTMAKPLHAGKACENGLLSAQLAAGGFTADRTAIEAERGFAQLCDGGCDVSAALAAPPSGWYVRDNLFKYHASCFFTHSMLEGLGQLRAGHGPVPDRIERVYIHVSELELGTCAIAEPATALEVKFSLAHLAAMTLLGRSTSSISDDDAIDPAVVALRSRVVLVADGESGAPTRVEIARAGERLAAERDVNAPERDLAAQARRLEAKFRVLAIPVLGADAAERLLATVLRLERDRPVPELMALSRG